MIKFTSYQLPSMQIERVILMRQSRNQHTNADSESSSIKQRNERIIQYIQSERKQIQENLKKQFQSYANKWERTCNDVNKVEFCYAGLASYIRACENLMNVYFPIISQQQFVALQSENSLMSRLSDLKTSIFKSLKSTATKLWLQYDHDNKPEPVTQNPQKKNQKISRSTNIKTPIQNSSYLTQWLLLNFNNPYPSTKQKQRLATKSNLEVQQVNNWFINARERVIKKYLRKETKENNGRKGKNIDKVSDSQ